MLRIKLITFSLLLVLSGCASIVSSYIQDANDFRSDIEKPIWLSQATHHWCASEQYSCIDYIDLQTTLPMKKLDYTFTINGVANSLILNFSGKVTNKSLVFVLFPGYRASKESLEPYFLWLHSLGYRVIISEGPNSNDSFDFGLTNTKNIKQILNGKFESGTQYIAVGFSMGIIAATAFTQTEPSVIGTIGIAPMQRFDLAIKNYESYFDQSWWSWFVSDENLFEGISITLNEAKITLEDTDVRGKFSKPTLLLASRNDLMAPYEYFSNLNISNVTLVDLNKTHHIQTMLFPERITRESVTKWIDDLIESK